MAWWAVLLSDLGLIAVTGLVTVWFSHCAQEKRRKEQEARERDSMRSVLRAELYRLLLMTKGAIEIFKDAKKNKIEPSTLLLEPLPDDSYRALVPRIQLLSKAEIDVIPLAYQVRRFSTYEYEKLGDRHPGSGSHVDVDSEGLGDLIGTEKDALNAICVAVKALDDEGQCQICAKEEKREEAVKVAEVAEHHCTDGEATRSFTTFQSLCQPCFDKSQNLTKSQATT